MRILLLNPPTDSGIKMVREGRCMQRRGAWTSVWAPISLATMASLFKKNKFEVKLIDATVEAIDFSLLEKIIRTFKPALVILNTATGSIESDLSVASLSKKIDPKTTVAAFGIHVTVLPEESFKLEPKLDFIVRGEPEMTVLELAETLKKKKKLNEVKGLSYQENGKIIHNQDRLPIENLDNLPFPAWECINVKNYQMPLTGEPFLLVGTGRGCPFNCLFCADKAYYGQRLRLPSAKRVVDELEYDLAKFKVNSFLFWSESSTLNKNFIQAVCREISARGLKIRFVVNSRVDQVDEGIVKSLKKAGCWQIGFGVESAVDKILSAMRKGIKVEQIKKAVEICKKAGLLVTGHFMLGFPGETKETILETVKLACKLPFDFAQFYCCVPFPGSDLYSQALARGWIKNHNWRFFEQNFSVLDLPVLSSSEVMALRRLAYQRFYLRPKIIFGILSKIRSPQYFMKAVVSFKDWIR